MLTITLEPRQLLELLCEVYLRQLSVVDVGGSKQLDLFLHQLGLIDSLSYL